MLTIFVRHTNSCLKGDGTAKNLGLLAKKLSSDGLRNYKKCSCPKYFTGKYNGKWYPRTSCDACTWEAAEQAVQRVRDLQDGKITASEAKGGVKGTLLKDAVRSWVTECRNDELRGMRNWEHLGEILVKRAGSKGLQTVEEITPVFINEWRTSWSSEQSPRKKTPGLMLNTRNSRMRRLTHFLNHCVRMGYIKESPMRLLKPKGTRKSGRVKMADGQGHQREDNGTMPLDEKGDANYRRVLAAIPEYFAPKRVQGQLCVRRGALGSRPDNFTALLQLMYTTGLRISDALLFEIDAVKDLSNGWGSYTATQYKTGRDVTVAIEPWLLTTMRNLPRIAPRYLFWDGRKKIESFECSQVGDYLREIRVKLGMKKLNAHQFRDSFAVNKLNDGWKMQDVSKALGHAGIAITERYYAKWVKSREEALLANWMGTPSSLPVHAATTSQARPF